MQRDRLLIMSTLFYIPVLALVAIAAATDVRQRRIRNWLTLSLAIAGLLASLIRPDLTFGQSAAGLGIGLVVPFALFALGMLGAGDAKLLAAIGAWVGPVGIVAVMLLAGVIGGLMAVGVSAWQGQLRPVLRNSAIIGLNLVATRRTHWISATDSARAEAAEKKATLPYAVAIFLGLVATQVLMATGVV